MPTPDLPPSPLPEPAVPTERLIVDGIELAPAERLAALAAIRDRHRAQQRFCSDRAADLRERIVDKERALLVHKAAMYPTFKDHQDAQTAVIEGELRQLRAAREEALAEAAEAGSAAGAASLVLRAAIKFAKANGANLPLVLAEEDVQ